MGAGKDGVDLVLLARSLFAFLTITSNLSLPNPCPPASTSPTQTPPLLQQRSFNMPAHQLAIDHHGFMLQLPALGLVDPAGEWVTLRAACGTMEQCAELLAASNTSIPPLRATETEFGVVRAQFQSAMWSVPTIHAQRQAKPEVFRVRIKRQSPSALPADIERTRLPIDTEAIFLSKTTLKLEAASLPISQTRKFKEGFSVQVTGPSMSDTCSKETLDVYRLCLNTTAAHSEQDEQPADPQAAANWQKQRRKRFNAAMDLWLSNANYCLNLGWMQGRPR